MNDLRTPLIEGLEHLAVDLAVGRHGDPHVGFLTLLHPDRAPTIIAVTPQGAVDLAHIAAGEKDDDTKKTGSRFFTAGELKEAGEALDDADYAIRFSGWDKTGRSLGEQVVAHVAERWQGRKDRTMKDALDKAAAEAARPAVCPKCHERFTERGLTMHRARSRWCHGSGPPCDDPDCTNGWLLNDAGEAVTCPKCKAAAS